MGDRAFVRAVRLTPRTPSAGYPFGLPAVRALAGPDGLNLDRAATFLVGENGSGKSTLMAALAVGVGFNPEGGSRSFRFVTRASESVLGRHVGVVRASGAPRTGYFLRAESFYNVASEIERLGVQEGCGGRSPHERSHGESFLDLAVHRFGPHGLYLLDEPEAALSVRGTMALLARMHELVGQGCQFVVATHSLALRARASCSWRMRVPGRSAMTRRCRSS